MSTPRGAGVLEAVRSAAASSNTAPFTVRQRLHRPFGFTAALLQRKKKARLVRAGKKMSEKERRNQISKDNSEARRADERGRLVRNIRTLLRADGQSTKGNRWLGSASFFPQSLTTLRSCDRHSAQR